MLYVLFSRFRNDHQQIYLRTKHRRTGSQNPRPVSQEPRDEDGASSVFFGLKSVFFYWAGSAFFRDSSRDGWEDGRTGLRAIRRRNHETLRWSGSERCWDRGLLRLR